MKKVKSAKKSSASQKRFHDVREMLDIICKESSQKPAFYVKSSNKFRPITYARLRADIRSLGATLTHRGLGGKKLLLLGESSYQWALAYLTSLCGLGTVIPLDKDAPDADICEIAKLSGAAAVLYSSKYEEKINALPKKLQKISFDELSLLCEQGMSYSDKELREFDSISIDSDATATILFTKGTTGSAKGVMLSQRNICSAIEGFALSIPQETDGISLSLLPLHYAYESVVGIIFQLSRKNAIVFVDDVKSTMTSAKEIAPTSIICSPAVIERLYRKIQANINKRESAEKLNNLIKATDAIKIKSLQRLSKKKIFNELHNAFGGRLEFIIVSGSSIDTEVLLGMQSLGFQIIQAYGLTETTALAAVTPTSHKSKAPAGALLPIGELKISDADSSGIGEICYRGDNVMLGYYKQDDLNKEIKQNGWIRTGDLGSIDSDGYLTVIGRKKNAITVSQGKTVYPEEIEALLQRNPYIKESAVIGIKNTTTASTDIVAVICADHAYAKEVLGVYSSRPMIKERLASVISDTNARLPVGKRISYFVLLDDEIPKNAYKKIDRSALAEYVINEYLPFE